MLHVFFKAGDGLVRQIRNRGEAPQADLPTPVQTGNDEYYLNRRQNFVDRHQGDAALPPPEYYLHYAQPNMLEFINVTRPKLSAEGQDWVMRTRDRLQQLMEFRVRTNGAEFARLECQNERFSDAAFDEHPIAYEEAGLNRLPWRDLFYIVKTPRTGDLLSRRGIRQVVATARNLLADKVRHLIGAAPAALSEAPAGFGSAAPALGGLPLFGPGGDLDAVGGNFILE